jgi:hypothetical protein
MTEKEERLARDRAEIAARVASFRETQQKFEREREAYYETTLANALNGSGVPRSGVEAEPAEACPAVALSSKEYGAWNRKPVPSGNAARKFAAAGTKPAHRRSTRSRAMRSGGSDHRITQELTQPLRSLVAGKGVSCPCGWTF